MDIVNLITTKNNLLKQPLLNRGFTVNEFDSLVISDGGRSQIASAGFAVNKFNEKIKKGDNNYSLVEIPDFNELNSNELNSKEFLERIKWFYKNSKLIIFSETMTPNQKKILLKFGISDCITHFAPERIASYIKSLNFKSEAKFGKFIVLDDNIAHRNILHSIIKRFGYGTTFISTIEELFQVITDSGNIMVLVNIGTTDLDLNALVRRSFGNADIKKNPVIAYKNMDEGLFIHEIINGLNNLTNVIFTPEELYSMLIDILFKKEIISHTNPLITSLQYEKNSSYYGKTLQQIYYENSNSIFGQESLFERDRIDSMTVSLEMMRKTLIRIEGIIWLKQSESDYNKTICGTCG
jgi:CheY-like chemotaxis protein